MNTGNLRRTLYKKQPINPIRTGGGNGVKAQAIRRLLVGAALVLVPALPSAPAHAGGVIEGPCRVGHPHVLPPGCVPSISDHVEATVAGVDDIVPTPLTLPNLHPHAPLWDIQIGRAVQAVGPGAIVNLPGNGPLLLQFTTIAANIGDYPLELLGTPTGDPLVWDANQCVSWTADRICLERRGAGTMAWHPDHNHFHFDDFARYELRSLLVDGSPDFSTAGLRGDSGKVSFCLQDSTDDDSGRPQFYAGCAGALQGISPGWADVYAAGLPGQGIAVAGIPDGRYALVFTLDPTGRLAESNEADNVSWSTVELSGNGTAVRLVTG